MHNAPKKPTIRDVAKAASVSMGTVSRVAAGGELVTEATQKKVQAAMDRLGYVPNIAARTMRTNRTMMVGLLVPDFANPVFAAVAKAAERTLANAGYSLFVYSSGRSNDRELAFTNLASQHQMDGVIVSLSDETSKSVLSSLAQFRAPMVILDRDTDLGRDVVFSEHAEAMRRATNHLIKLGHTRIALITAPRTIRPGRERIRGFTEAMQSKGLEIAPGSIAAAEQSIEYGYKKARNMLSAENAPTAILAAGNDIMYGIMKAVRQLEISIPDQLSIIGVDDRLFSELMVPAITMIDRDMGEVGEAAAKQLLARMAGTAPALPVELHLPSVILMRDSTAPAPQFSAPPRVKHSNAS